MALSGNMEQIDGRLKQVTAEDFTMITQSLEPMVDVYFPVDEHRNNWYENKDKLLIAVVHPAKEWEPATAYKLNGEKVLLDPYTPPEEPVLVVSLCEHGGIHLGNAIKTNAPIDDGDGGGGSGGGSGGGTSCSGPGDGCNEPLQDGARIIMHKMKQDVCEEGWALGDPEIRYSIKESKNKNYLISNENPGDLWDCTYGGFLGLEIFHDYNWKTINHYDFFWHFNDYGNFVVYHFFESDGGWPGKEVSFTFYGITFKFDIGNDDEDMGAKSIHKDDGYLEPGVDQAYDSGDMRFYIDWQNPD